MKHPPFASGGATHHRNWLTREGARDLGLLAQSAWALCGVDVPFVVEPVYAGKDAMWTVKFPTLVNGMPVR